MASIALTTLLLSLSFLSFRDSIAAVQVLDDRFPVKEMNYPVKVSEQENYGVSHISMAELKRRRIAGRKLKVKAAESASMAENTHEGESKRRPEKDLSDSNHQLFGILQHPSEKQDYSSVSKFEETSFNFHITFPNKFGQHFKHSSPASKEFAMIDQDKDYSGFKDPHQKPPIHN